MTADTEPVRVLVVDDHVFYREGLKTLLGLHAGELTVVGEAGSGEAAIALVAGLAPDVVLMDLTMPGMGGVAAAERLTAEHPGVAVLVLTMHEDDFVLPALRAGARGYLLKDAGVDDLVRAIVSVHHGETVLGPLAAARVHQHLTRPPRRPELPFPQLTEREHDLLAEIARGGPTSRSRGGSGSARRRCATTCPTCSSSCRPATARTR